MHKKASDIGHRTSDIEHRPSDIERISANLSEIRATIAEVCHRHARNPQDVRLIAVTKEQEPSVIAPLIAAGVKELGENRIDHLELMQVAAPPEARFHFIGRVQGRQLAKLAPLCVAIHSLCEADHIERLGRACAAACAAACTTSQRIQVFVQVNVANDAAKAGVRPDELAQRIEHAQAFPGLEVVGLMTMAPLAQAVGAEGGQADERTIRTCFSALRVLAEHHHLPRLSMGMSDDFHFAVAEGATDIRVGSRLFR